MADPKDQLREMVGAAICLEQEPCEVCLLAADEVLALGHVGAWSTRRKNADGTWEPERVEHVLQIRVVDKAYVSGGSEGTPE